MTAKTYRCPKCGMTAKTYSCPQGVRGEMRAAGMIGIVCNMLYGRWYVAPTLFVLVAGTLPFLLGGLDAALPNRIVIGKDWSVIVLFAAFANLIVSAIVAVFRRRRKSFILRLVLLVPAFVVNIFVAFMLVCVPTRMRSSPSDGWVEEKVVKYLPVARNQLSFCGGIDARLRYLSETESGECDWKRIRQHSVLGANGIDRNRFFAAVKAGDEPMLTAHAYPTIFYVLGAAATRRQRKAAMDWICDSFSVASVGPAEIAAAHVSKIADFEDAIVVAAARSATCSCIVTRNVRDFTGSTVLVATPEEFARRK